MRVYELVYRDFIAAENRGGTFHVILWNGSDPKSITDPLTPEAAAKLGFDDNAIFNAIDSQLAEQLHSIKNEIEKIEQSAETDKTNFAQAVEVIKRATGLTTEQLAVVAATMEKEGQ